jgi:hypothetical protein
MPTTTDSPNINSPQANWIDKVISVFEMFSLVLLIIPFGGIAWLIITEIFLGDSYFPIFSMSMFLFLPIGVFALLVQLIRIARKRTTSSFNKFMLGSSIFTVIVGVFACMAIYVAVG